MTRVSPVTAPASTTVGVRRWALRGWVVVLVLLLLGPALGPGFVLSYDMVWVPQLTLRPEFFGLGSSVPRAVPSDAVIGILDNLVPAWLLQKLVLAGSLVAGGLGIAHWVEKDGRASIGAAAAATVYVWNPYVAERLVIGHWPMLLCYGIAPWLARSVLRSCEGGRIRPEFFVLVPLASLSASAGVATVVIVSGFAAARGARRLFGLMLGAVLLANLPWIVAGILNAGALSGVDAGARFFRATGEAGVPMPLTAISLGGIWNTEVVPGSRTTPVAWVTTLLVVVAFVAARSRLTQSPTWRWLAIGAVGWLVAVLGWLLPGGLDTLAQLVPGFGLLRDSSRLLVLLAPAVALAVGITVSRLATLAGEVGPVTAAICAIAPVFVMPDAAWGIGGRLDAVHYPSSYAAMREAVEEVHRGGDVLVLPFTTYRAPTWNGHRKVFDPVGRYQPFDQLVSDVLVVDGTRLTPEAPRAEGVMRALGESSPDARAAALARLGIGTVVTDRVLAQQAGQVERSAQVSGRLSLAAGEFEVTGLDRISATPAGHSRILLTYFVWAMYFLVPAVGVTWWRLRRHIE